MIAKDRLTYTEGKVSVSRQSAGAIGGNHATDFFKRLMGIQAFKHLLLTGKPRREFAPTRLTTGGHAQAFDKGAQR